MSACRVCQHTITDDWLDFGFQSLSNRFLYSAQHAEYQHPLAIGFCRQCGTVQLRDSVPTREMKPQFDWIFYNEPESHLDDLADVITRLPGLSLDSTIAGLTYKDESTLRRLKQLGFEKAWLADARIDLGVEDSLGGIESIQECLNESTAKKLVSRHGRPDVLLVRHVLEHSHDIHHVLSSLREIVAPNGYVVFEMPDARRALERNDYSTVWEEHIFYFTPVSLRGFFERAGLEVVFLESYFYTLENSLVAIVRHSAMQASEVRPLPELSEDLQRAERFIRAFPKVKEHNQRLLRAIRQTVGSIAFLGAGHLSSAFINLYQLHDLIDLVVDDNTKKQGLFMPGSRLPILPSSALIDRDIKVCLMGVRPEIEDAVLAKNRFFLELGGRLVSIFPDSRFSLYADEVAFLKRAG